MSFLFFIYCLAICYKESILFCPCAHLFVCLEIWIHGFLFHSMGCDPALSFILMFKLHQIWPEKAPSIWLLYLFDTSPYSLPSDTTTCPDSTSTFSKSSLAINSSSKSWIPLYKRRIAYSENTILVVSVLVATVKHCFSQTFSVNRPRKHKHTRFKACSHW